jgi:hypothetical protein
MDTNDGGSKLLQKPVILPIHMTALPSKLKSSTQILSQRLQIRLQVYIPR